MGGTSTGRALAGLTSAALVLVGLSWSPAAADTQPRWATWTPATGSSGAFAGSLDLGARFPDVTWTSDSLDGGVGVQTGASTYLPAWTPPGRVLGSSQNRQYLNLRPRANNASSPSTTTYTFSRPTPQGWAFVLGDVDADAVRVSGTTADGSAATAADLGFRSTFNYCAQTPRPCSPQTERPTWDAATRTLTGNAAATDTDGASAWFRPTVALRSLTLEFTRRSGFPVYQTWFASVTQDLTGTVGVASGTCSVAGLEVRVVDRSGEVVDTTTTGRDGTYSFADLPASPGYTVELAELPEDCIGTTPRRVGVDLSSADGTADFTVREIVPAAIGGRVVTDAGDPVAGATVTIDGPGGQRTAVTADDGRYLFDDNAPGEYSLALTTPDGYRTVRGTTTAEVPAGTEDPQSAEQDLVVAANPDVTGTLTQADGGPAIPDAVVQLRDADGTVVDTAVTDENGDYAFSRVPAGDYTVAVPSPPGDYRPGSSASFTVDTDDETQDLALVLPGTVTGSVVDQDGDPVPDAEVVATNDADGSTTTTTTADDGTYALDLDPGDYTIVVTPPGGEPSDPVSVTVEAGQEWAQAAIEVVVDDATTPPATPPTTGPTSPVPSTPPPAGGSTTPDDVAIPDTGGASAGWLWAGGALVLVGAGVVGWQLLRRR